MDILSYGTEQAVKPIFSTQGLKTTRPTLLRRATVIHANKTLLCTGHGHIMIKKADSWRSFHEYLKSSKIDQWCFSYIKLQDTGNIINQATRNNEAIAIRDGSYKDTVGTAAFIIEGTSSAGRIQTCAWRGLSLLYYNNSKSLLLLLQHN